MKHCPKCNSDYFDNMLEFCLDDGTKLVLVSTEPNRTRNTTQAAMPDITNEDTVAFSAVAAPANASPFVQPEVETVVGRQELFDRSRGSRIIETAAVVLALAHNWWQWLYLEKQYISSVASFLVSANFLMWLLLLIAGAAVSLFALKYGKNKAFGYISLVVMAINLILFLVPRR